MTFLPGEAGVLFQNCEVPTTLLDAALSPRTCYKGGVFSDKFIRERE